MNLDDVIINEIRENIKPINFGLKSIFDKKVFSNDNTLLVCFSFPDTRMEYDCLSASIKLKNILNNHNILCKIVSGEDYLGLWTNHTYVKLKDGIIDLTPPYYLKNVKHKDKVVLEETDLNHYSCNYELALQVFPLSYRKNKSDEIISCLGINYKYFTDRKFELKFGKISKYNEVVYGIKIIKEKQVREQKVFKTINDLIKNGDEFFNHKKGILTTELNKDKIYVKNFIKRLTSFYSHSVVPGGL